MASYVSAFTLLVIITCHSTNCDLRFTIINLYKIYLNLGPRHPINDIRLLGVSLLMNKAKEIFNEDLVTGLEGQTHFGRPDFSKILLQHNQEWAGNGKNNILLLL